MTPSCRHCGSSKVVKDGQSSREDLRLAAGEVEQVVVPVARYACRSCGRTSNLIPDEARIARDAVRDHVVDRVFASGRRMTARETGLGRSTIGLLLEEWGSVREEEPARAAPDFLMVETVRIGARDHVLLVDVDSEGLIEILRDASSIPEWAAEPGRPSPLRVCHGIDPATKAAIERGMPDAERMIAPRGVARALTTRALLSLRSLKAKAYGSNAFPRPSEFVLALRSSSGEGWPPAPAVLANATRAALSVLESRDRIEAEHRWPEFAFAAAGPESRSVLSLMETWRAEILSGVEHRYVDTTWSLAMAARRALASQRPVLAFDDLRRLALLRDFVSVEEPPIPGRARRVVAKGTRLAGLPSALE